MKLIDIDLKMEPYYKKQRTKCPHCDRMVPIEEVMECDCGAVFELEIRQVLGPDYQR